MTQAILFSNNQSSTLAGAITAGATSCNLAAGTGGGFPNPAPGQYFLLTLVDAATGLTNEITRVTARNADVCTIVRAQEGTQARAWQANDVAANLWTAGSAAALAPDFVPVQQGGGALQGANKVYLGWGPHSLLRYQIDVTDEGDLASTSWVQAGYQPLLEFTPVQQGGGANQGNNKLNLGWDGASPRLQVDGADVGRLATQPWVSAYFLALTGGTVTGLTTFQAGLTVSGGTLAVSGAATVMGALRANAAASVGTNLTVGGAVTVTGALAASATASVASDLSVGGEANVVGDVLASGNIATTKGLYASKTPNVHPNEQTIFGTAIFGGVINSYADSTNNDAAAHLGVNGSTSPIIRFFLNGAETGNISTVGSSIAYNTNSDHRLKTNVEPLACAVDRVRLAAAKRFSFLSDPSVMLDGFLAHEIAAAVPGAVSGTFDQTRTAYDVVLASNGRIIREGISQDAFHGANYPEGFTWAAKASEPVWQSVDQAKLVPVLWAAVQELADDLAALRKEMGAT